MTGPFEILARCIGSSHLRNNLLLRYELHILSNEVSQKASCEIVKANKLSHAWSCNTEQKWTGNHSKGSSQILWHGYHECCVNFLNALLVLSLVLSVVVL